MDFARSIKNGGLLSADGSTGTAVDADLEDDFFVETQPDPTDAELFGNGRESNETVVDWNLEEESIET